MNNHTLRDDIRACLTNRGISIHRLAQKSGVDAAALWRFINDKKPNLTTDSLFRLWPFLYGGQRPLPVTLEDRFTDEASHTALLTLCLLILSCGTTPQKQALKSLAKSQPALHAKRDTHPQAEKES